MLIASKVAEFELELEAMKVAVVELRPKLVEAELVSLFELAAIFVGLPGVVGVAVGVPAVVAVVVGVPGVVAVAESMGTAFGVPFEPA